MIQTYIIGVQAASKEDAIKKFGWAAEGLKNGQIPFEGFVTIRPSASSFQESLDNLGEMQRKSDLTRSLRAEAELSLGRTPESDPEVQS